jgi:hypothetical protein
VEYGFETSEAAQRAQRWIEEHILLSYSRSEARQAAGKNVEASEQDEATHYQGSRGKGTELAAYDRGKSLQDGLTARFEVRVKRAQAVKRFMLQQGLEHEDPEDLLQLNPSDVIQRKVSFREPRWEKIAARIRPLAPSARTTEEALWRCVRGQSEALFPQYERRLTATVAKALGKRWNRGRQARQKIHGLPDLEPSFRDERLLIKLPYPPLPRALGEVVSPL